MIAARAFGILHLEKFMQSFQRTIAFLFKILTETLDWGPLFKLRTLDYSPETPCLNISLQKHLEQT
jgi:hypothetical protein